MQDTTASTVHTVRNLPAQAISEEILLEKFAKDGERTIAAVNQRVEQALAQAEATDQRARWEQNLATSSIPSVPAYYVGTLPLSSMADAQAIGALTVS